MANNAPVLILGKDDLWFKALKKAFPKETKIIRALTGELSREIKKQGFALIIIDTQDLPQEEIASQIQLLKKNQETAVIIVASVSPTWRAVREAFKAGADDFIAKTLNPGNLLKSLKPYFNST